MCTSCFCCHINCAVPKDKRQTKSSIQTFWWFPDLHSPKQYTAQGSWGVGRECLEGWCTRKGFEGENMRRHTPLSPWSQITEVSEPPYSLPFKIEKQRNGKCSFPELCRVVKNGTLGGEKDTLAKGSSRERQAQCFFTLASFQGHAIVQTTNAASTCGTTAGLSVADLGGRCFRAWSTISNGMHLNGSSVGKGATTACDWTITPIAPFVHLTIHIIICKDKNATLCPPPLLPKPVLRPVCDMCPMCPTPPTPAPMESSQTPTPTNMQNCHWSPSTWAM